MASTIESLGITYGGRGIRGEFYFKGMDDRISMTIWTEGEESWTAGELEAIAAHKRGLQVGVLRDMVLSHLRACVDVNGVWPCVHIPALAAAIGCEVGVLFDRESRSGVLADLDNEDLIGFTWDMRQVYATSVT